MGHRIARQNAESTVVSLIQPTIVEELAAVLDEVGVGLGVAWTET